METQQYRILERSELAPDVVSFWIVAPRVARAARPGQFVIVRVTTEGERIPLTIAASAEGAVRIIVQGVGKSTRNLNRLVEGDTLADVAGPLGTPSEIDLFGTVACVGGGVGTAVVYPVAAALAGRGNDVIAVVGGRSRPYVILEEELATAGVEVHPCTDDGSHGYRGFVSARLEELIEGGREIARVVTAGPIPMMRAVADVTRPRGIPTVASLNPIMVDGTGMCGGCRVLVGNETRFACVDGPEFDAHLVDFDVLAIRNSAYRAFERERLAELDACRFGVSA